MPILIFKPPWWICSAHEAQRPPRGRLFRHVNISPLIRSQFESSPSIKSNDLKAFTDLYTFNCFSHRQSATDSHKSRALSSHHFARAPELNDFKPKLLSLLSYHSIYSYYGIFGTRDLYCFRGTRPINNLKRYYHSKQSLDYLMCWGGGSHCTLMSFRHLFVQLSFTAFLCKYSSTIISFSFFSSLFTFYREKYY